MPNYWMITNRPVLKDGLDGGRTDALTYWTARNTPLTNFKNWQQVTAASFEKRLAGIADGYPLLRNPDKQEDQPHVALFVHGFNVSWSDAVARYEQLCAALFAGDESMGECVLFTWPSDGRVTDYLPDRLHARLSGAALADVLDQLYDWLLDKQKVAADSPARACRAKVSVIAHSMGNYVLQKAAQLSWTRHNQPLLVSLVNQCLMVAADVDNDLFSSGESHDLSDGDALANLVYRITVLYSGLDQVLGASAGLKHFGKRRLGRSGLDPHVKCPDNVWEVDCTPFFLRNPKQSKPTHSAYFDNPETLKLMRQILRGVDRKVLQTTGVTRPVAKEAQALPKLAPAPRVQRPVKSKIAKRSRRRAKSA